MSFSSKSEVGLLREDMDILRIELKAEIEKSSLRVENNLKSEINTLINLDSSDNICCCGFNTYYC